MLTGTLCLMTLTSNNVLMTQNFNQQHEKRELSEAEDDLRQSSFFGRALEEAFWDDKPTQNGDSR